ncbi:hypothetical protein [Chamaesiphon sp. OTE_8_metabat_110]|uniref:hypothetical protein n=1 Tax=Chamaesiphon sp. OTE_8_metabat_110 TaxID=2964696 RepID=UPI00286A6793|nr:hypothetical protein [Chamaesiphon sp. OTE_8_metabat_110]
MPRLYRINSKWIVINKYDITSTELYVRSPASWHSTTECAMILQHDPGKYRLY